MNKYITILCIGDIFGKTGRRAISELLPKIKKNENIDIVIANAENTTHCKGLNLKHYNQLLNAGVDYFTMGNHTWSKPEILQLLDEKNNIIRPYNLNESFQYASYGNGTILINFNNIKIRLTNLLGNSVYFNNKQYNPFIALNNIINNYEKPDLHIVDFHCESSGEKNALLYAFKNKVNLIYGTHTHIQTADNKIIEKTAYITDIGMTGPYNGVIGCKPEIIVNKYLNNANYFKIEEALGKYQFCAIKVTFDIIKKIPIAIDRIYIIEN